MIDFEWAMHEHTAELFKKGLAELDIAVREVTPDEADAHSDDAVFALLERAGLMLDQQVRIAELGDRTRLIGSSDADTLAQALVRFAHEHDAGGVLIDMAITPAQITELRGVNGSIIVLADDQGARQLQPESHLIATALARATASST